MSVWRNGGTLEEILVHLQLDPHDTQFEEADAMTIQSLKDRNSEFNCYKRVMKALFFSLIESKYFND